MAVSPSNIVVASTNKFLAKRLVDTVLQGNTAFTYFIMAAIEWNGGRTHQEPVWMTKNTLGGSYYGMDTFATQELDMNQVAEYNASFYNKPCTLSGVNITLNENTNGQALNLIDYSITQAMMSMADDIGNDFYGDGTGNNSKALLGLNALVDNGTAVPTYAGLSRSTYPTWAATQLSSATLTLAKMATRYSTASNGGSVHPTVGFCTKDVHDLYEQLLQPQERIAKDVPMMKGGLVLGTGARLDGLYYKGMAIMPDEKCTTGSLFFLDENFIDFAALPDTSFDKRAINFKAKIEGNDYSSVKGLGFTWSDWIKTQNGNSATGAVYFGGQLIGRNPKRNTKITDITGV